jgi:hypothetical protein
MKISDIQISLFGHFVYLEQFAFPPFLILYMVQSSTILKETINLFIWTSGKLLNLASRSLAQPFVDYMTTIPSWVKQWFKFQEATILWRKSNMHGF